MTRWAVATALLLLAAGCSEEVGPGTSSGGAPTDDGARLVVDVPASGRVFLRLAAPEVVVPAGDGAESTDWDLAFSGYDVLTNSGLSGPGEGGALPVSLEDYETGELPGTPYLIEDDAGGAFTRWYAYDSAEHVIYSRFHVHAIEHEGRYWKLQIITFYGEVQGTPVRALYRLRYAEVLPEGPGPTVDIEALDATAGGIETDDTAPSACLDLAGGQELMLTPEEARASTAWHVCFRRSLITVNGELGGPGKTRGADLQDAETADEDKDLAAVMQRTAESEAARFEAIGYDTVADPAIPYRGDHIATAFTGRWLEPGSTPPAPAKDVAWLIQGADGQSRFVLLVDGFEGATASSPGRVSLRVKQVE
ncbi:HmuY family protein [Sorangium sp. So ce131]|uniref:HmuY family protein n=1 Tax=Sorangium sp. So ce131 TaxID=3133282 RepID=UPI003F6230DA